EGRNPGKRPFVAAITGGPIKPLNNPTTIREKQKRGKKWRPTTASITGGPSNPKGRSGGTTKRRVAEMCSVRTEASGSKEKGRSMLCFNDDVSRILIDQGSSCDVMYQELFEKLGLKKEDLCQYEGTDLQGFNGFTIRP
ncbi:hypothetical protein A2U01_0025726, partial [Trifolium medium]|nr:hypothetical protein [Trifolium medium]